MDFSIIIPIHKDEEMITYTLRNLKEKLKGDYEIIVVYDYCNDALNRFVNAMTPRFTHCRLIANHYTYGFANAIRTGIDVAEGKVVIPVMADSCDEVEIIPQMLEEILKGYDIVCGSRYIQGGKRENGSYFKTFASFCFNRVVHLITKIPNTDLSNPFKAYRKSVFKNMQLRSTGFEISMEIVLRAYFAEAKITELPTQWRERNFGKSHFVFLRDSSRFLKIFLSTVFCRHNTTLAIVCSIILFTRR